MATNQLKSIELRERSSEDLEIELKDQKHALYNLRFQRATSQLENHMAIVHTKRNVAKLKSILREREISLIKDKISTTIAAESKSAPVSDKKLAQLIADEKLNANAGQVARFRKSLSERSQMNIFLQIIHFASAGINLHINSSLNQTFFWSNHCLKGQCKLMRTQV